VRHLNRNLILIIEKNGMQNHRLASLYNRRKNDALFCVLRGVKIRRHVNVHTIPFMSLIFNLIGCPARWLRMFGTVS
jgi:hypothetical protein